MSLDPYDYLRIRVQMDFKCHRCGICCQVADPIDIYPKDIRRLASYFELSLEETIREYTIPHPSEPDIRAFKVSAPCRFYDKTIKGCKIYPARPMVCRCSPFLSPGQIGLQGIEIYEDCPASRESLKIIERDLDPLLNPDPKMQKKLEKALSKMMQIE
ncbi:Putative zinc- or iron-chelating domain protein [uncultured archaeon]|nr:Putative zinc- or iron-chelating domain protein [uncultured archaeon]